MSRVVCPPQEGKSRGCRKLCLPHTNLPIHPQTTKAFLPRMLELQNGHIVCLNSVLALSAIPGAIDYCTSKASAFAFMESLTLGLLDCPGVSATTVLPFHSNPVLPISNLMETGLPWGYTGRSLSSPL